MIAGALVLPPVIEGMIEASATRRPSTPRTFRSGDDDRELVDAHPAGADAVVHRGGAVEDRVAQRAARSGDAPGWISSLTAPPNAAPPMISRTISRALGEHLEVGGVGEVLEVDQRRGRRVGRGQPQGAAALRVDQRDQHGQSRCAGRPRAGSARPGSARRRPTAACAAAGRVRRSACEVLHEADRLEDGVRQERRTRAQHLLGQAAGEERGLALHLRRGRVEGHRVEHVVVQVVPDREVGDAPRCRGRAGAGRGRCRRASAAGRSRRSRPRG